jgi:hypothetical protein
MWQLWWMPCYQNGNACIQMLLVVVVALPVAEFYSSFLRRGLGLRLVVAAVADCRFGLGFPLGLSPPVTATAAACGTVAASTAGFDVGVCLVA